MRHLSIPPLDVKAWNMRHFFPSSKSGNVFPISALKRRSVIRDMGRNIIIKTSLDTRAEKKCSVSNVRYWSSLLDWEVMDDLTKRTSVLIDLCIKHNYRDVKAVLENVSNTANYVLPSEFEGYGALPLKSREFMKVIFIHSDFPKVEDLLQDFLMVNGVGIAKAKKIMQQGILLPEDLFPTSHVLWFRPNKNHVRCLIDKFQSAWNKKNGNSLMVLPFDIVGGFGRGKDNGHDIDLLCVDTKIANVKDVMNDMETIAIDNGAYLVFLLDTMVRVDISSYKPELRTVAYMHHLGPAAYNIWMRKRAIDKGYSLSQNGLFKDGVYINVSSEDEVNTILGISKGTRERWWKRY